MKILVEVLEPTCVIKMNAAELEFTDARIGEQEGVCAADAETETVTITTAAPLEVGKQTIEINFVGIHNDDMKGFYRTKSTNKDGVDEYSLVTQFEGQGPLITVISTAECPALIICKRRPVDSTVCNTREFRTKLDFVQNGFDTKADFVQKQELYEIRYQLHFDYRRISSQIGLRTKTNFVKKQISYHKRISYQN